MTDNIQKKTYKTRDIPRDVRDRLSFTIEVDGIEQPRYMSLDLGDMTVTYDLAHPAWGLVDTRKRQTGGVSGRQARPLTTHGADSTAPH